MSETIKNKGWMVTYAGLGINLALGILYTWSIFKAEIAKPGGSFNWDPQSINDPYAICCLFFAFSMILAGRIQDKFGPRLTAMIGGVLVGAGVLWVSQTYDYTSWVLGFGVLAGIGIGFGYSSATPPALKWFPAAKTGLIAGLVVSGFGLASVYIAPLAKYLIGTSGLQSTLMIFGIAFLILVCILSLFLVNPPAGYVPEQSESSSGTAAPAAAKTSDVKASEMLKQSSFWMLWFVYFVGAGAGLMVIGNVAGMAKKSMGELAFIVVATMAVGNAGGRIVAGILSDKIGRSNTLMIMLSFQALLMFASMFLIGGNSGAVVLVIIATSIGFNYGTNLSLFPSFAKDLWGLKNFGVNYGILFTAWGVGGFFLSRFSQMIKAATGSFNYSFLAAGILLIIGVLFTMVIKKKANEDSKASIKVKSAVKPTEVLEA